MYCSSCGAKIDPQAKFCPACGAIVVPAHSPAQTSISPAAPALSNEKLPAGIWLRLADYLLDRVFVIILAVIIFVIAAMLGWFWISYVLWISYIIYFLVAEGVWQRSLGKLITGTKVVMRDGRKPPFKNILGRTFARIIPFEPFSFLFSAHPMGWHDSLSGTIVVPKQYSESDVKSIDFVKAKSEGAGAGVIIAIAGIMVFLVIIIGILSSIVLVSLNTARQKSRDAHTIADIQQIRTALEASYDGSYGKADSCFSGPFSNGMLSQLIGDIQTTDVTCYANGDSYVVSAGLGQQTSPDSYCVDSSGFSGHGTAALTKSGAGVCTPVSSQQ